MSICRMGCADASTVAGGADGFPDEHDTGPQRALVHAGGGFARHACIWTGPHVGHQEYPAADGRGLHPWQHAQPVQQVSIELHRLRVRLHLRKCDAENKQSLRADAQVFRLVTAVCVVLLVAAALMVRTLRR